MDPTTRAILMASSGGEADTTWTLIDPQFNGTPVNWKNVDDLYNSIVGLYIKPDGTAVFFIDASSDQVVHFSLSTAWDISTASFVRSFSVNAQETNPVNVFFKDDGTKMYVCGTTGDDVNEYTLSTAWDISTASYSQAFSVSAQTSLPTGMFFGNSGTKMYVIKYETTAAILEYTLSTGWDVSTATYVQSYAVGLRESNPYGVWFKSDGTKMFVAGNGGNDINEFALSTAWDISTATYTTVFPLNTYASQLYGLAFKGDGTKAYIIDQGKKELYQFDLSTAWDISTTSFTAPTTDYLDTYTQDIDATDLFFKPDGTELYVLGDSSNEINQFTLSTAWELGTASYTRTLSVNAEETSPNGLFFKPDGTKMYVCGFSGDDVNEYSLSTAWDISTASYIQSIATNAVNPGGLAFKDDGTKMYVSSLGASGVEEYALSTAWNVSTASYTATFSTSTQLANELGLFFKDDGTKMFVSGDSGEVNEYALSTAWDVTTASFARTFLSYRNAEGIAFKSDGTKLYIVHRNSNILAYDLVTP